MTNTMPPTNPRAALESIGYAVVGEAERTLGRTVIHFHDNAQPGDLIVRPIPPAAPPEPDEAEHIVGKWLGEGPIRERVAACVRERGQNTTYSERVGALVWFAQTGMQEPPAATERAA